MISVQGVFDLGCKHPSLPCYCLFKNNFQVILMKLEWGVIGLIDIISVITQGMLHKVGVQMRCVIIFVIERMGVHGITFFWIIFVPSCII